MLQGSVNHMHTVTQHPVSSYLGSTNRLLVVGIKPMQVTKPLTTVTAPPGQQVQVTPVYGDDGTNSLQGIGEEELLLLTVLKPSLTVGSPSQLQGERCCCYCCCHSNFACGTAAAAAAAAAALLCR
jgi:hypothetical protein